MDLSRLQAFDLVIVLALIGMFIVGYAQGVIRRLLGIAAVLFSLVLAAQLRQPLGEYLSQQWTGIAPQYSYMVAFGAVFAASAFALSLLIQLTYRPAPLFDRYPVLDEILGGILGVLEGFIFLIVFLLVLDPYYTLPEVRERVGTGEFTLLRTAHDLLDSTLIADILRNNVIPVILAIFGFLFPQDVVNAFPRLAAALTARS
ncbi:MAG TPA: CvpA family protein [Candidatus Binatia bacterium]|nr:CvpA family protein [Candidatus Binatia bacterium]